MPCQRLTVRVWHNEGMFMQGAEQVSLDGVFHSMSKGSRGWPIEHRWYGSEDVLDHWAHHLV